LVCKDPITLQLLEVSASIKEQYKAQATRCPADLIFEALGICNQCDVQYKISKNQRLHVELALIQLSNIDPEKKNDEPEVAKPKQQSPSSVQNKAVTPVDAGLKPTSAPISIPRPTTPSLKDALKGGYQKQETSEKPVEIVSENTSTPNSESNQFTQEQLIAEWKNYAEGYKTQEPRMYSTLIAHEPLLKDRTTIEFSVSNQLQEEAIRNIKVNLLNYLKKSLNNYTIDIVTNITEKTESNKLYTSEDKFEHMVKKNPDLYKLKQQFNLDFE
jgi:DNA polymerase-3 subunit gamma/tau